MKNSLKFLKIPDKGFIIVNEVNKSKIKIICKNLIINAQTGEKFACMFPNSLAKIIKKRNGHVCDIHWEEYSFLYELYSNGIVKTKDMCLHCITCTCKKCDEKYYGGLSCNICGEYKFN